MSIVRVSNLRKKYPSFDLACPYTETRQPSKTHWLFNRQYLKLFNLDENKSAIQLSEGMKVKCNLLFALSHGAEALILDEPTSGLDPFSRDELLELFETIKSEGVAIFFSTHIITDIEKCADDIVYISHGRIAAAMPKDQFKLKCMKDGESLEDAFLRMERNERAERSEING